MSIMIKPFSANIDLIAQLHPRTDYPFSTYRVPLFPFQVTPHVALKFLFQDIESEGTERI